MSELETLRHDLLGMVEELRATLHDIGDQNIPQNNLVSNARDRLRYISVLTEQSAGQTLSAAEAIADRLRMQQAWADELGAKARSPEIRAFFTSLREGHERSRAQINEIIEAQAFQDLVGQVVGKLMNLVQRLEDSLVHVLVDDIQEPELLAGPIVKRETAVSQAEVDDLFG
jgi:chemotaxis protein CheZ